jgi:hypothetical protein
MAADLLAHLDLDPRQAIIDGHLDLPAEDHTGHNLRGQLNDPTSDLALGVLFDRGQLPVEGRLELERLAAQNNSSIATAARLVLDAVRSNPLSD